MSARSSSPTDDARESARCQICGPIRRGGDEARLSGNRITLLTGTRSSGSLGVRCRAGRTPASRSSLRSPRASACASRHFAPPPPTSPQRRRIRSSRRPCEESVRDRSPTTLRAAPPTGLYDPANEHDACGVAFVARLDAEPSHETVRRALQGAREPRAPRRRGRGREHGRRRRDPRADPGRVLPRRARRRPAPPGAYGVGAASSRATTRRRARARAASSRRRSPQRGSAWSPGATSRSTRATSGATATPSRRVIRQLVIGASADSPSTGCVRAQALRDPARRRAGRRRRPRRAELLLAHGRLQGDADGAAARAATSPTSSTSASRARSRSSTRASRRTRSRAGSSRTRTG